MKYLKDTIAVFCLLTIAGSFMFAQTSDDLSVYNEPPSRLRGVIEKFSEDYGSLNRFYTAETSPNRAARFGAFFSDWLAFLNRQNFDSLNADEQIDFLLFKNYLAHEIKESERRAKQFEEMSALLPFARTISDLEDSRRRLETLDAAKSAALLNGLSKTIAATQKSVEAGAKPKRTVANHAAQTARRLVVNA